jgi:GcrA cell cycle regulator
MSTTWTDEQIERLKILWAEGRPASKCATILNREFGTGYSRNSVIGKVHRAKLMLRGRARPSAPKGAKPKMERTSSIPRVSLTVIRAPRAPRAKPEPAPLVDATLARPWIERSFGQCAYPISGEGADTFSCCQPTEATYCKAHAAAMYRPWIEKPTNIQRLAKRYA